MKVVCFIRGIGFASQTLPKSASVAGPVVGTFYKYVRTRRSSKLHWLRSLTQKAENALRTVFKLRSLSKFPSSGCRDSFLVNGTWIGAFKP